MGRQCVPLASSPAPRQQEARQAHLRVRPYSGFVAGAGLLLLGAAAQSADFYSPDSESPPAEVEASAVRGPASLSRRRSRLMVKR